jgi:hypothetical protein
MKYHITSIIWPGLLRICHDGTKDIWSMLEEHSVVGGRLWRNSIQGRPSSVDVRRSRLPKYLEWGLVHLPGFSCASHDLIMEEKHHSAYTKETEFLHK